MREMIKGKHLGKVTTYDTKTGKETESKGSMMILPARAGTCEECAVGHTKDQPHDAMSIFYQYHFYNRFNKWPTWKDAMEHCPKDVKALWKDALKRKGVKV